MHKPITSIIYQAQSSFTIKVTVLTKFPMTVTIAKTSHMTWISDVKNGQGIPRQINLVNELDWLGFNLVLFSKQYDHIMNNANTH